MYGVSKQFRSPKDCQTHPVYRNPCYNPDILSAVPLDEHTSTRLPPSNTRTWQTTSILAYVEGYTRARIRMHHPSYRDRVANACRLSIDALVLGGVWAQPVVAGNSGQTVGYDEGDSEVGLEGNQPG